jgi:hypothetical protein
MEHILRQALASSIVNAKICIFYVPVITKAYNEVFDCNENEDEVAQKLADFAVMILRNQSIPHEAAMVIAAITADAIKEITGTEQTS